jgi:hypothetical protein
MTVISYRLREMEIKVGKALYNILRNLKDQNSGWNSICLLCMKRKQMKIFKESSHLIGC